MCVRLPSEHAQPRAGVHGHQRDPPAAPSKGQQQTCDPTVYLTPSNIYIFGGGLFFSVPQCRAAVHLAPPLYRQQLLDLQPQTRLPGALRSATLLTFSKEKNKTKQRNPAVTAQNLTFPTHFSQILAVRRNKVSIFFITNELKRCFSSSCIFIAITCT